MRPDIEPLSDSPTGVVTFRRAFPAAVPPLRGDKAALGTIPTAAYQYCEPIRTASSFGWYIFPPADIRLIWNGVDLYYESEGEWRDLTSVHLTDEFVDYWDSHAPEDLKGHWPPFMTKTFVSGIVQIWSGLLISTAKDWSVIVGAPPNLLQTRHFSCFEGVIETDRFKPAPLFINLSLHATDREILIARDKPLFFVRPVRRECYSEAVLQHTEYDGLSAQHEGPGRMTEQDWEGYRRTVRKIDAPIGEYKPGRYAVERRKRAKREEE
jgi:hypothetical protein